MLKKWIWNKWILELIKKFVARDTLKYKDTKIESKRIGKNISKATKKKKNPV